MHPSLVNMATSLPNSKGMLECIIPPAPEYSPSVFSLTITQSIFFANSFLKGDFIPVKYFVGLMFAY